MLMLRVPHGEGESPASLCSRLAYRTHAGSVHDFCLDMGFTFQSVVDGEPDSLAALARVSGCDLGALTRSALRRVEGRDVFDLAGQSLRRASLRRSSIRVCPACLADDQARWPDLGHLAAYGRTEWQVAHFRTCPIHGMPLVTAATGDTPTRVHDFSLLIRPALERIGEAVSGAAARKPSGLETYLRNRLHGLARRATDWLDSLSFHAAARLCEVVGAVALHGPQVKINDMTDDDWWEVGDIGYDALADGADGLRTVLDRLSSNYWSRTGCTGPKGLFGRLYMWLAHETDDPDYEPVREVITNHVMDTMPVGPGDEIFGKPVTERRLWSVYTASRQSDVIPQRLRKMLAAAGFIAGNSDDMTDHRVVFPATPEVNKFLERTASMMSLKKAGDYLNIPQVQLYLLYRNGVITPFIGGGDDNAIDPAFTSGYLDEFLARLTADATERTDVDTGLADIPHTAKTARCSAVDIVQMLLERRLTRVRLAPDLTGFRSVLVDPDEIRQLMHRPREEGMIMKEVELTMRWSGTVVRALVENGWLPSRQALNPINNLPQTLVDRHDLDSFNADYVSLHGLACEHGRHFMILKRKIDAAGIRPAFCPDMAKATFYRRADLPPL